MSNENIAVRAPVATSNQRGWNIALWVLQVGLVTQFVGAGFLKITGSDQMVDMFADIGAGQWLRVLTGTLELAGAVGLLIPALCGPAALGLAGVMVGATITNVFILEVNTFMSVLLLVVALVVVWGRRDRTAALVGRLRR